MPDPFRHYEGVPVLDLPADPPSPEIPALQLLLDASAHGPGVATGGPAFLSQLLFYSAAISASKLVPSTGYRYALRVNPSSGNLHPTEFHFLARDLIQWPGGLYHYRPSSHMAERRALGNFGVQLAADSAPLVFILTSIAWREAWKYRDRAYRYCLLDMGHAWQSLALAARAMGCDSFAEGHFPDEEMAESLRLNGDEWPMLIVRIYGGSIPVGNAEGGDIAWSGGRANQLSTSRIPYPLIEEIHAATKLAKGGKAISSGLTGSGDIRLPSPASSNLGFGLSFGNAVRTRRSALDFTAEGSMSLAQLSAILHAAVQPLSADFAATRFPVRTTDSRLCANFVQLYLYAHRVDGLQPGVYRHWPDGLERIKSGDQRVMAAGLSLGQDLAGNACVAFSMIADLDRATAAHGDRGYRYVHFEAGAIGQRLYLAAEALRLRATGIGAFFDDEVNRYLELGAEGREVIYHFAIGHPVPDPRVRA